MKIKNVLSVDVEDWFHILELESTPDIGKWDGLESRVEKNFFNMLDEFDKTGTTVTCFILGWVAEKHPQIIREAAKRGHEIASHGFAHQLVYTLKREEFAADITKTKKMLEDISGQEICGYRAPGFSITKDTPWAMEELAKAGYKYDSSIFPAARGHGGINDANMFPYDINTEYGIIREYPISVAEIFGKRICFFGGGYLRLFPYGLINKMSKKVNSENRSVVYYVHPREIDPGHPRLQMGAVRKFKSYVNLKTTMPKIIRLLKEQNLTSFSELRKTGY